MHLLIMIKNLSEYVFFCTFIKSISLNTEINLWQLHYDDSNMITYYFDIVGMDIVSIAHIFLEFEMQ